MFALTCNLAHVEFLVRVMRAKIEHVLAFTVIAHAECGPLKECTLAWVEAPCWELAAAVVISGA